MSDILYPKGSEWRKWDLHLHTPFTKLNNNGYVLSNGKDVWNEFCDKIEKSDVEVFGITDYFSVDNYFEFQKKFRNKYPSSNKIFFPNIELRIDRSSNNRNEGYDLHLIFNNEILEKDLQSFLNNLKLENTDGNGKKIKASELKTDTDFKTAFTTIPLIDEALKDAFGDKKPYFRVLMAHGHGGLQPEKNNSRKNAVAEETDKRVADIYFGCDNKDREFFLNDRGKVKKKKPCVSGSDAHSFKDIDDKVGKTFLNEDRQTFATWIKADKTFEGLQQIIYEPRERIFLGEKPDKLSSIEANSSKFIESIKIHNIDSKQTSGWFNDRIPINPGLVAIIGRKGQGKSALADIIALCGKTKIAPKDFSFLNKDKFRKKGLAKNYEAVLTWLDKITTVENLDSEVNQTAVEKVKYLPQKYVETICNEDGVSIQFQREVDKVIFSYIPDESRLSATTLEDLVRIKTSTIHNSLTQIRNNLHLTNENIVKLENKLLPKYLETLTNKLKARKQELDSLIKPKVVQAPKKQPKKNVQSRLEKIINNIEDISAKIETAKSNLKAVNENILKLDKLKAAVNQLSQSADNIAKDFSEDAKLLSIDLSKLYSVKVNSKILNTAKDKLVAQKNKLTELLNQNNASTASLFVRKLELEEQKKKLVNLLGEDQRKYSAYQDKLKEYNERTKEIKGSADDQTLETIKSIEAEIIYLNNDIHADLKATILNRNVLAEKIYSELQQKREFYKEIYQPLQKFIEAEKETQEKTGSILEFDADVVFEKSNFSTKFLSFINQNKDGSFQYTDNGQKVLNNITEKADFSKQAGVKEFTQELIDHLASDKTKTTEKKNSVSSQLKGDNILFYDYIFGLGYLDVKYKVLFNGKDLNSNEFSPGEKGALLLIFYLLIDKDRGPLIMDQPEENLDNESIFELLVPYIRSAKTKRQVIIVTHNPNLAIVCDAEQIITVSMNKQKNRVKYEFGSIENLEINKKASDVLEGTLPAFDIRGDKYIRQ